MPKKTRSSSITSIILRAAVLPLKVLIALAVFVDELLRPIYRPIVKSILDLAVFTTLERQVSALPRWAILIAFAVPFLVVEPLKLVAIILFAKGSAALGVITFLVAQLLTFILVERIYHAGRSKLLSYGWFSWAIDRAVAVRNAIHIIGKRTARRIRALIRLRA